MPSFKMTDFSDDEIRQAYGGASNARQMVDNRPYMKREVVGQVRREKKRLKGESEILIREFMSQQTEGVLFLDICDHLNRRPSPILRQIVNDMVLSGELVREEDFGAGPLIARHIYKFVR